MSIRVAYAWFLVARVLRLVALGVVAAIIAAPLFTLIYGAWPHGPRVVYYAAVEVFRIWFLLWSVPAILYGFLVLTWRDVRGSAAERIDWRLFGAEVTSLRLADWLRPSTMRSIMARVRPGALTPG